MDDHTGHQLPMTEATSSAATSSAAVAHGLARLTRLTRYGVATVVLDVGADIPLWPEEERTIAGAGRSRRREFAAGRACARRALARLGCPPQALGRGSLGEPLWPAGWSGSITHDGGLAAAIAHRSPEAAPTSAIDLVASPRDPRLARLAPVVLSRGELSTRAFRHPDPLAIARVLSAKEAAVKILAPLLGRVLDLRRLETTGAGRRVLVTSLDGGPQVVTESTEVGGMLLTLGAVATQARSAPFGVATSTSSR
jgi:4'-phosphopantetheinyl transferase EntD